MINQAYWRPGHATRKSTRPVESIRPRKLGFELQLKAMYMGIIAFLSAIASVG